ncbi:MAG: DUF2062 domain-containing protein [Sphingomicrobium sp.]|nr:DUF2062 domain-containing protein [Sphingomonadales bacterium]
MPDVVRSGFGAFVQRHIPTPESIGRNRLLRPFARQLGQPNLWRMNHRSVPRAVALGLAVGVIMPFLHMVLAALLAIPARANVAMAAAFTLVVNPLTIPPMYYAAYHIGKWELRRGADVDPAAARQVSGEVARFLFWIHHASGPIALGILTIAATAATLGYVLSAFFWRHWITSQYRARRTVRRFARRSRAADA